MAQKIKFVTDSASDIPRSLREELDILVLPFPIAMGAREYQDGVDFTATEFYDMLLAAPQIPTHAQLTPFVFSQCFEEAFRQGYTDLIYTSINSKGSATHQNALQAREEFYEDRPEAEETFRIHILDSRLYTMAYGWAVVQGARMAREEKPVQEILAYIQDWIDHARVLFAPLDLRFAKKSGRVSAAAAFMGEALGLKPVMTFEGRGFQGADQGAGREECDPDPAGDVPKDPGAKHPLPGYPGRQPGAGGAHDRRLCTDPGPACRPDL